VIKSSTYLSKNFATALLVSFNLWSTYSKNTRIICTIAISREPNAREPRWYLKWRENVFTIQDDWV